MSEEWEVVRLGDYTEKIGSGATPRGGSSVYLSEGIIRLIRSQNIYNDGFSHSGIVFITDEAGQKLRNAEVREDDVLLNITGDSVARVCMPDPDILPARVNQHVAIIRTVKNEIDPLFLRYFLSSPRQQAVLLNLASAGATRNALTKGMIEDILLPKPSFKEQLNISSQLLLIDQKIHLLRQQNATLEAMAQALFKSWFVDFDPVIDNALAAGRALPEALAGRVAKRRAVLASGKYAGLPAEVKGLFPEGFWFSEELGRWVPEGWEVKSLSDLTLKISKGTTPRKSDVAGLESSIPFLKVRNLSNDGKIDISGLDLIPESVHLKQLKRSILEKGDLLFSIAGTIGRTSIVPKQLNGSNCNQALAFIRLKKEEGYKELIDQLLKSDATQHLIKSQIVQAVQANVSLTTLGELNVILPSSAVLISWKEAVSPFYQKTVTIDNQITTLTRLRDVLLPELISGRVKV